MWSLKVVTLLPGLLTTLPGSVNHCSVRYSSTFQDKLEIIGIIESVAICTLMIIIILLL